MSFLKRMFSADYRAAMAAEAAGNVELAAERYAMAGDREAAVRMHLARAARAADRAAEISALRDALHWSGDDLALRAQAARGLGLALLARATAEGIATARDHDKVREAARLLSLGGDHRSAGEAYERISDWPAAATAYSTGGLVERVEAVLTREEDALGKARTVRDGFAEYETELRIGRRDDARAALAKAVAAAAPGEAGEYRRLLDQLESKLITGGRVTLRRRRGGALIVCATPTVSLGRDVLCDLPLRAGCVSRHHAEILIDQAAEPRFALRDAGSRNGTSIGGLPLSGRVPLAGAGSFDLGDDCKVEFKVVGAALVIEVVTGLDRGAQLIAAADGDKVDLSAVDVAADLIFAGGRPWLAGGTMTLEGEPVRHGRIQLIRGDHVGLGSDELEVA